MSRINISGTSESRVAPVIANLVSKKDQSIIVVSTEIRAKRLASDLSFFAKDKRIIVLPQSDGFFIGYEAKNHDLMNEKLACLKALVSGEDVVVIVPVTTAIKKLPPKETFGTHAIKLRVGDVVDLDEIKGKLTNLGYERTELIEGCGQFSIRGGIIDVFTPDFEIPYRIELFGDEIDSIRSFNVETQRSVETLDFAEIYPAEQIVASKPVFDAALIKLTKAYDKAIKKAEQNNPELAEKIEKTKSSLVEYIDQTQNTQILENYLHYFYDHEEYIWDYMQGGQVIVDDPDRICEIIELKESEDKADFEVMLERGQVISQDSAMLIGFDDFKKCYECENVAILTPFPKRIIGVDTFDNIYNINSRQVVNFNGNMNILESELKHYVKLGYKIIIVSNDKDRLTNLSEFVERIGLDGKVRFELGTLSNGIDYPEEKIVWISENDIFLMPKKKKKAHKKEGKNLQSFSDMHEGDFVVHENHGIGKYIGIEQLNIEGEKKDYIKLKYAGNDMLYVPVEQMDMVQKYIGSAGEAPRINKLSGTEWHTTKQKAKAAIAVMAQDLIELYAERANSPGHAFSQDTVWQSEFEDAFPYEETGDQIVAIEEIKRDMEKPTSMDRLLLGDVGFGKTEVAARAMFKCLTDGKQAAFLVPTTILANQHYYTLKERFEKFPFKVEVLSRFKTAAEQHEIIKKLETGEVDLVIGTHRLLSGDIKFKDLGLLVVDEEQRFGVEDKEKIKKLRTNVDVLTLSATPIPRTLNMSLNGIKDMSVLEEPPVDRYPVQTYVLEQDDQLLKDIIEREIGRGGQVYVVFNRVRGISQIAERIEALVPDAEIAVGHGQMSETALENVMMEFISGEKNVLIATSIIESGLDIPNANTMVILDSDRYGLSQLYQLRGRVGRSNRIAYCYLMYQKDKVLTENAEKRLKAIKEFTEFGAGFKVAMKDLEIRGAGNLLGTAQSGHIANIGYELYCKMVNNAVRALQGEIVKDEVEEVKIELPVSAYIPQEFIENEATKLEMYKKIALVHSYEEEDDVIDEMLDRFGDVPSEAINLVKIAHIKHLAEFLGVKSIHYVPEQAQNVPPYKRAAVKVIPVKVVINFGPRNGLNAFSIYNLSQEMGEETFVHLGKEPFIKLTTTKEKMLDKLIELLMVLESNKGVGK